MIKWINKPYGKSPVQADGYFLNHYFYFRARWEFAEIEFYKSEEDFWSNEPIKEYLLLTTEEYEAGWLSHRKCYFLILKGLVKFAFDRLLKN
jgi:hypothetical protein